MVLFLIITRITIRTFQENADLIPTKYYIAKNFLFQCNGTDWAASDNFFTVAIRAIFSNDMGFSIFHFENFRAKRLASPASDAKLFVHFCFWHKIKHERSEYTH